MSSEARHRRKVKIRRTGRHTAPNPAEKVAQQAGRAAPALAVVGVLAASPQQVHKAAQTRPAATSQAVRARLDAAVRTDAMAGRSYTVRDGDTLSGISQQIYGNAGDWRRLYQMNSAEISDPDLIYVGQVLGVPKGTPASPAAPDTQSGSDAAGSAPQAPQAPQAAGSPAVTQETSLAGTLTCVGLETLWESAGGTPAAAVTAASIAMAESGGEQYATGPFGERGYWQINPVNGAMSTYDAYGNARAAVAISDDGADWNAWTTWASGASTGKC